MSYEDLMDEVVDYAAVIKEKDQRIEELKQKLKERETYWLEWNGRASVRNEGLEDALEKANRLATQRGARMQIMREWIADQSYSMDIRGWEGFCLDHPEATDWFNEDGVPVKEGE